jgi:hypothetical protein
MESGDGASNSTVYPTARVVPGRATLRRFRFNRSRSQAVASDTGRLHSRTIFDAILELNRSSRSERKPVHGRFGEQQH